MLLIVILALVLVLFAIDVRFNLGSEVLFKTACGLMLLGVGIVIARIIADAWGIAL